MGAIAGRRLPALLLGGRSVGTAIRSLGRRRRPHHLWCLRRGRYALRQLARDQDMAPPSQRQIKLTHYPASGMRARTQVSGRTRAKRSSHGAGPRRPSWSVLPVRALRRSPRGPGRPPGSMTENGPYMPPCREPCVAACGRPMDLISHPVRCGALPGFARTPVPSDSIEIASRYACNPYPVENPATSAIEKPRVSGAFP